MVHQHNLNLIRIPCWWDGDIEKLASTINFHRPDLFSETTFDPILLNPPFGFFNSREIPGVGELMVASFPEDEKFNKIMEDNTWWLGEKYDGVRFCWNPIYKTVYSRSAREISVLPKISNSLPSVFVEGEIWFGRGQFGATSMLIYGSSDFVQWHILRMMMFDVPSYDLHHIPFEKRYEILLQNSQPTSHTNQVVFRTMCKNKKILKKIVEGVIDDEGEGVMLRRVRSRYENGRSDNLIKLKTSYGDAEGIVVKHGTQKSVILGLTNGKTITIPHGDILIPTPDIGNIVSFSFEKSFQKDLPANPKIFRVRNDISWEDVIYNAGKRKEKKYLNDCSRSISFNVHPIGHWMVKRMRVHLENFARNKNMNPDLPETWYQLAYDAIHQFPSGKAVLSRFNGSYYKVFQFLFPDMKFDKQAFPETAQMRSFFEKYAQKHSFDPRNPENWYLHFKKRLLKLEGANRIKFQYNNSVPRALLDLFPDIGLDKNKFKLSPLWYKTRYRRKFFEDYAKENSFDPRVPENWYIQLKEDRKRIYSRVGASRVMFYHKQSISRALLDLFPDIGLEESKFPKSNLWYSLEKSKMFLDSFAKEHNFDPLVPGNWYDKIREIRLAKTNAGIKFYRNQKISEILLQLYPNIGFEISKFPQPNMWDVKSRRKFFENYAEEHNFDPLNPESWYSKSRKDIENRKGAIRVLFYYDNVAHAIQELFPEIGFDPSKIPKPNSWYGDINNRRKFFEEYANTNGFDPLDPQQWYQQSRKKLSATLDGARVLAYHNHSMPKALLAAFPSIGLFASKFPPP